MGDVLFPWREIGATPCRETQDFLRFFVRELYWSTKRLSQQITEAR
ncbi:MAG: hypothetical protein Q8P22_05530 [Chloroflexota bacterium]|nr:hypothetical protein [Chloroflexota bacterium]